METFETNSGRVRGFRASEGVVAVLGVPYAEPPFGPRRFKEPQPAAAWAGVRGCTRFGAVSPQSARLPGAPAWSPGDEDILTVNIWTPAAKGDRLPVLVWIHGGAYTFGSSAQPDFDGTALARAGVVVVTLNYRVGFEGFGHIPAAAGSVTRTTAACSTRSRRCTGSATTSPGSVATRATSPSPASPPERRRWLV